MCDMKVTMFLDTSRQFFESWLEEYTKDAPYLGFSTESGNSVSLQSARSSSQMLNTIGMEGILLIPGDETTQLYPISDMILFKIVPLTHDRTEVTAECRSSAVVSYFVHLLKEIDKRWPQTPNVKQAIEASTTRLERLQETINHRFDDLQHCHQMIYELLDKRQSDQTEKILKLIQRSRIEQGQLQNTVDAIRRVLHVLLSPEAKVSSNVRGLVQHAKEAMESEISLQQKFKVTLPIIPYFIDYKIEWVSGVNVDVDNLRDELVQKWNYFLSMVDDLQQR